MIIYNIIMIMTSAVLLSISHVKGISFHCYADDIQLNIWFKPHNV